MEKILMWEMGNNRENCITTAEHFPQKNTLAVISLIGHQGFNIAFKKTVCMSLEHQLRSLTRYQQRRTHECHLYKCKTVIRAAKIK